MKLKHGDVCAEMYVCYYIVKAARVPGVRACGRHTHTLTVWRTRAETVSGPRPVSLAFAQCVPELKAESIGVVSRAAATTTTHFRRQLDENVLMLVVVSVAQDVRRARPSSRGGHARVPFEQHSLRMFVVVQTGCLLRLPLGIATQLSLSR